MGGVDLSKTVVVIPSRLESSRVEKKPLVDICGLPMIVHVYKRACLAAGVAEVVVATDSVEILDVVEQYGGKAILTASTHQNGTERLAEAVEKIDCEYVVLVNGDEALVNPEYILQSLEALMQADNCVASILANQYFKEDTPSDFKLALNCKNEVMYISRGDIPCTARNPAPYRYKAYHVMAFKKAFLSVYAQMEKTPLERIEDHEHLRILENGYKIQARIVESSAISVDTLDDLAFVREQMLGDRFFAMYKANI